jgi:hypothetical protein
VVQFSGSTIEGAVARHLKLPSGDSPGITKDCPGRRVSSKNRQLVSSLGPGEAKNSLAEYAAGVLPGGESFFTEGVAREEFHVEGLDLAVRGLLGFLRLQFLCPCGRGEGFFERTVGMLTRPACLQPIARAS